MGKEPPVVTLKVMLCRFKSHGGVNGDTRPPRTRCDNKAVPAGEEDNVEGEGGRESREREREETTWTRLSVGAPALGSQLRTSPWFIVSTCTEPGTEPGLEPGKQRQSPCSQGPSSLTSGRCVRRSTKHCSCIISLILTLIPGGRCHFLPPFHGRRNRNSEGGSDLAELTQPGPSGSNAGILPDFLTRLGCGEFLLKQP